MSNSRRLADIIQSDGALDVTGAVTADGLTVEGNTTLGVEGSGSQVTMELPSLSSSYPTRLVIEGVYNSGTSDVDIKAIGVPSGGPYGSNLNFYTSSQTSILNRMKIASNGNVSFYEGTGSTVKMLWDASSERLEVGTQTTKLSVHDTFLRFKKDGNNKIFIGNTGSALGSGTGTILYHYDAEPWTFWHGQSLFEISATGELNFRGSGQLKFGTKSGENGIYLGKGDTNLYFYDYGDAIIPVNSLGTDRLNSIDLGATWARYKRQYLSDYIDIASNGNSIRMGDWDGVNMRIEAVGRPLFITSYDGSLNLGIDNDAKLTVSTAGNVGIGTSNPIAALEINTGTGTDDPSNTVAITRPTTSDYSGVSFRTADTTDWSMGHNSTSGFSIYENGLANSTRFIIKDGGNVGINNDSPDTILDIKGDAPTLTLRDSKVGGTWSAGTELGKLDFYTSDSTGIGAHSVASIGVVAGGVNTASPDGHLLFSTGYYNTPSVEHMRISSLGNIGIGTRAEAAPANRLTFGNVADDPIQIRAAVVGAGNPAEGTGISWTWRSTDYDNSTWAAIRTIFPGNGNTHITFSTQSNINDFNERMRIHDDGGITAPYQYGFKAQGTTSVTGISADQKIPFNAEIWDKGACYNPTLHRFTAPVTGYYSIGAEMVCIASGPSTAAAEYMAMYFRYNGAGTSHRYRASSNQGANGWFSVQGATILKLNAGDYVEVYAYTDTTWSFDLQINERHFWAQLLG